jgi:hypothetical protein
MPDDLLDVGADRGVAVAVQLRDLSWLPQATV